MVIFILVSFSASFQTEVEVLVVAPLEKMLSTLRSSATVMLKSMNAIEKETGKDEVCILVVSLLCVSLFTLTNSLSLSLFRSLSLSL